MHRSSRRCAVSPNHNLEPQSSIQLPSSQCSTASPILQTISPSLVELQISFGLTSALTFTDTAAPEKLLVTLRDGRKLIGILRSWDQYGNLVLQDSIERRFLTLPPQSNSLEREEEPRHLYSDEERGIYIVRGENIVLMGEIVRMILLLYRKATPATSDAAQELAYLETTLRRSRHHS